MAGNNVSECSLLLVGRRKAPVHHRPIVFSNTSTAAARILAFALPFGACVLYVLSSVLDRVRWRRVARLKPQSIWGFASAPFFLAGPSLSGRRSG
jgi:hypothetical protein